MNCPFKFPLIVFVIAHTILYNDYKSRLSRNNGNPVTIEGTFVITNIHGQMVHRSFTDHYSGIPFQARSTGRYKVHNTLKEKPLKKDFIELFWAVSGKGEFIIDGKPFLLSPGEVCFYTHGDTHDIHAATETFQYWWMVFDGVEASKIWQGLGIKKTPHLAGTCPEELFLQLTTELEDYTPNGLKKASATAFRILMLSSIEQVTCCADYDAARSARNIFDSTFQNPQTSVSSVAESLMINRSQLSRKFHATFGVSPIKYLINLRIQHGISLLGNEEMSVKEIAFGSGFSNPGYFTKAMKRYAGITVSNLRNPIK